MKRIEILAVLVFVSLCILLPRLHAQDSHEEAMGKALQCEKDADYAQKMHDDIYVNDNPTVTFAEKHGYEVYVWMLYCRHNKQPVRQCVISKCVGGQET